MAFNHNFNGVFAPLVSVATGYRCQADQTFSLGAEYFTLHSPTTIDTSEAYLADFTSSIFPFYRLGIQTHASLTCEVGQIMPCEKRAWLNPSEVPVDPRAEKSSARDFKPLPVPPRTIYTK